MWAPPVSVPRVAGIVLWDPVSARTDSPPVQELCDRMADVRRAQFCDFDGADGHCYMYAQAADRRKHASGADSDDSADWGQVRR